MLLFRSAFISVGRVGSNLRLVAAESAVELSASVTFVLLGTGAAGAVTGRGAGYAAGAVIGAIMAARAFSRTAIRPGLRPRSTSRRLVRYAGALFVVDGAFALFNQIDIIVIGRVLGSISVGLFAAPLRLCTVLHYPGLAVSNAVSPLLARADGHGPDARAFTFALRGLIVLQVAIAVPILIWARPIVDLLLGPSYADSAPVLRALTPFIVLQGLGPLISVSVNYLGQARRRVPIAVAAVLVNLVLDVILIPRIGIIGGAIATDVAYAIYVPAHFLVCRRALGLDARPLLRTCVRALLAGAVMSLPLLYTLQGGIWLQGWILGGGAALAAFGGVLLLTGELRPSDLRAVAARLTRRAKPAA
jgi:O-antigen/teichoic acid export membrane protein